MSLRDKALEAFGDIPTETVDAAGLTFEVRGLIVADAAELFDRLTVKDRHGETTVDKKRYQVEWVIAATHDPDTGDKVFEAADRDTLLGAAAFPVSTLAKAALELSGYGGSDEDAARELKSGSST